MSLLAVEGLSVRYRAPGPAARALRRAAGPGPGGGLDAGIELSLALSAGETLAIVGESGSGKSSLARSILGLVPFHAGRIGFEGQNPFPAGRSAPGFRRDVARMFRDPVSSLSPRRSVKARVTEPLAVHGLARGRDLGAEARRLLGLVGLPPDFAGRYPHQLSGGQARRVGLARAIALAPKLVIADEPTAGLDVSVQGEILNLLGRLRQDFGLSDPIITHNLAVVRQVGDRTAILYMGRIVGEAPTEALFAAPLHPWAAALIAAQPRPDPARRRTGPVLTGEVASLETRPPGCAFHPRCARASGLCRRVVPPDTRPAAGRRGACRHPLG